jgi:ribokinase
MSRICVVGAANMDLISYVARLPRMGETLHGSKFHMGFGGKGANQAVMAAKLGAQVSMVTKLGRDIFGENTLKNFRSYGIDCTQVLFTDEAFSGVAPIAVDTEGKNSIIIVTGANDLLSSEEIEASRALIAGAKILVCQLEIPLDTTIAALRIAHQEKVRTIFNPAPGRASLPEEIFRLSDILCPNESETELITNLPTGSIAEADTAARALLAKGASTVVLTLGERGSLLVTEQETEHIPAKEVKAMDSTGAGDAFIGSLAYFVAAGKTLPEAVRRATDIAAISVQASGTQSSFPNAVDLPAELLE